MMSNGEEGTADKDDKLYNQYASNDQLPDLSEVDNIFRQKQTEHAEDAIDYEDIDELADESVDEGNGHDNVVLETLVDDTEPAFDDIFGDSNMSHLKPNIVDDNHVMLDDLGESNHLVADDGLNGLNMEEYFGGELQGNRKRPSHFLSEEEKLAKKRKLESLVQRMEKERKIELIKHYFPDYSDKGLFNYHLHLMPAPKYYRNVPAPIASRKSFKPLLPNKISLEVDLDERKLFKAKRSIPLSSHSKFRSNGVVEVTDKDLRFMEELKTNAEHHQITKPVEFLARDGANDDRFASYSKDLILSTADWDDEEIMNAGDRAYKAIPSELDQTGPNNNSYNDDNIFEGNIGYENFSLDMNDPNLIFIPDSSSSKRIANVGKPIEKRFNISNDSQYEILKNNYNSKVRSRLSNLNIEHSIPALRLQSPYYKVKLSKEDARAFHRPSFIVRPGTIISFSKGKTRKRKNDRGKLPQEIFQKTTDLTLSDSAAIVGMEYAEEYPQLLSNFGMCSKLINYYRKEKEDDSSRPKAQLGETHVLGIQDRSPFWNFGEVAPGDFVPTLYNNTVRAPIFKHEIKGTDFLLIRSQGAGSHQRYFLRNINHMFGVGDIFPVVEVPAPHSRKVTNTSKNRLKMVVFRAMNNANESRISVKDISHHFPDQNDMQNRQRLKEFMEYQRQGDDQGFWKIKNSDVVPNEEDIRAMITPEDVCILDSMQYGQQCLEDVEYIFGDDSKDNKEKKDKDKKDTQISSEAVKEADKGNEKGKDQEKEKEKHRKPRDTEVTEMDIEEELAPWNLTRNFITANQSKTMLQLNGEGDPSGIGLGFSFMRANQKNNFKTLFPPPKEHVPKNSTASYQQILYDAEVKRVWYSQRRSLVDHGPDFDLNTIYEEYKPMDHMKFMKSKLKEVNKNENGKVLRIVRRFRDENNIVQRHVENISDPVLISAYLKRKKQIQDDLLKNAEVDDIIPTDDKELNKLRRKALEDKLASLEKKSKHNRGRKPSKDVFQAAAAAGGVVIDANTVMLPDGSYAFGGKGIGKGKSTTRRCASCGAYGHIRTKKSCPLYKRAQAEKLPFTKLEDGSIIPIAGSPLAESPTFNPLFGEARQSSSDDQD